MKKFFCPECSTSLTCDFGCQHDCVCGWKQEKQASFILLSFEKASIDIDQDSWVIRFSNSDSAHKGIFVRKFLHQDEALSVAHSFSVVLGIPVRLDDLDALTTVEVWNPVNNFAVINAKILVDTPVSYVNIQEHIHKGVSQCLK